MSTRLEHRPNDVWVAALSGQGEGAASLMEDLAQFLHRILSCTLAKHQPDADTIEDLVQESMLQLVRSIPSFRGDSAFSTWAASVATRVAFTELRRRAAQAAKHAAFRQAEADALDHGASPPESAEEPVRDRMIAALHDAIRSVLTDRQRIATLALLRGVPTIEIAEQLQSNQNAVYKLVHDARLRLRSALEQESAGLLEEFLELGGSQ